MAAPRGFTQVDDEILRFPEPSEPQPTFQPERTRASAAFDGAAIRMMQMAMWELSKRAVVALASLFMLATVSSVFVLWYLTPDPNQNQIVSMTIYAGFVLLVNYLNMRRK